MQNKKKMTILESSRKLGGELSLLMTWERFMSRTWPTAAWTAHILEVSGFLNTHHSISSLKFNWTTMSLKWAVLAAPLENVTWRSTSVCVCVVCVILALIWVDDGLPYSLKKTTNQVRELTVIYFSIWEQCLFFLLIISFRAPLPCYWTLWNTAKFASPRHISY